MNIPSRSQSQYSHALGIHFALSTENNWSIFQHFRFFGRHFEKVTFWPLLDAWGGLNSRNHQKTRFLIESMIKAISFTILSYFYEFLKIIEKMHVFRHIWGPMTSQNAKVKVWPTKIFGRDLSLATINESMLKNNFGYGNFMKMLKI